MAKKIGQIADEILAIQLEIKALEDQADELKKKRDLVKLELLKAAETQKLSDGKGKTSKFTIKPKVVPQAHDWDAFYAYVSKTKFFHLLQKRLTVAGCSELWEQGKVIPGVDKFTENHVTVSKA